mgnify:CR=1 FL=1
MTWTTSGDEHRFDVGHGDVIVVHGGEVTRVHLHIVCTLARTDGDRLSERQRAIMLAAPLPKMQRAALMESAEILRAALAKIQHALMTEVAADPPP